MCNHSGFVNGLGWQEAGRIQQELRPPPLSSFSAAPREGGEGEVGRDLWGHLRPSAGEEGRRGQRAGMDFWKSEACGHWSHRSCFRSGFSPWQGLEWSFPLRVEDRMIAFEVALMF